jgi:hypothetical protein
VFKRAEEVVTSSLARAPWPVSVALRAIRGEPHDIGRKKPPYSRS